MVLVHHHLIYQAHVGNDKLGADSQKTLENARWLRTKCGVINNSSHFLFQKFAYKYESRKATDKVRGRLEWRVFVTLSAVDMIKLTQMFI